MKNKKGKRFSRHTVYLLWLSILEYMYQNIQSLHAKGFFSKY